MIINMSDNGPRSLSYLFMTIYFRKKKGQLAIEEINRTYKEIDRKTDIREKKEVFNRL